jgi:RimJ/RimL family protein N-acetyltransferase
MVRGFRYAFNCKWRGFATAIRHSANPALIRVNEKLGFHQEGAEVRSVKGPGNKLFTSY